MPVAYTSEVITRQWTSTNFLADVSAKMVAIGGTQRHISGSDLVVEFPTASPSPTKKCFIRVYADSTASQLNFGWSIGDSWSSGATITNETFFNGTSTSSKWYITWNSGESIPLKFETYSSSEIKMVKVFRSDQQNGFQLLAGAFFPAERPTWHVSNSNYMYAFIVRDNEGAYQYRAVKGLPWDLNGNQPDFEGQPRVQVMNPVGQRDFVRRCTLIREGAPGGICGIFSSDFAFTNGASVPRGDQVVINGETWSYLGFGGNTVMAVRIA